MGVLLKARAVAVPIVLLLLLGCGHGKEAPATLAVVDDAGDTIRLGHPAQRIVSLAPASTELLFAIGAGPTVVGRTRWCDYPAAALAVPSVGDGIQPSIEAVVARHPDLVVLYHSAQNSAAKQQLARLGIPTVDLALDRVEDFERAAHLLGTLTGHGIDADTMLAGFDARLAAATRAPGARAPSVLILVWDQPPMTIGQGSFLSEIVERAGGRNLFADLAASAGVISVEAVVARKPDLVLVSSDSEPAFAKRPEWQTVAAVRERRFVHVNNSAFNRPSPRMPEAVSELAGKLEAASR
ncbi:MAG TPA: helical backbone metal receptor [Gemmatimonadales bacterium]|nr:helical backbone metal receptor [Gemmatimonadales bacterium]